MKPKYTSEKKNDLACLSCFIEILSQKETVFVLNVIETAEVVCQLFTLC